MVARTRESDFPLLEEMSAKKKGGKLSKAEKERLQRLEDERRQQEEEAARALAEREKQERLEREEKERAEHERLEQKDSERREDELNELRHLLEENQSAVTEWETDLREKGRWERYMRCDGSPDPAVQREINTFISLWREDQDVQIHTVLEDCNLALSLIEELDGLLRDRPEPADVLRYQENLLSLQGLVHAKHLLATEEILKTANAHSDIETGNMQTVVQDDNITLCLWANLKKNPRFKGFQFEEAGLGFELPTQLAVSDVAVRILHTRYDHLSRLARLTHPRGQPAPGRGSLGGGEEPPVEADEPAAEGGETEGEGEGREDGAGTEEEVRSVKGSEGRKSAVSVLSVREERRSVQKHPEEEVSQKETLVEGGAPSGERDSAPTPAEPVIDTCDGGQVVDLEQYTPLGGVFYCDAFRLPPQARHLNGWDIRELLDTGLQVFPYPTEPPQARGFGSATGGLEEGGVQACPPVGVTITLPDSVLFLEQPQVARWDPRGRRWRTDGIDQVSYDEAERRVSFRAESFCAVTLLQETYANMPFQSWELRPLGRDSALLTITAALIEVSISVKGNQCMLQCEQEAGLTHILGRWLSLPGLQEAMRTAGVNVFLNQHSDKYVSVNDKDPLIEHAVYEQMALLSSAFAFAWSQWNAQCGPEHLVLQVCEQQESGAVAEGAWSVYLLGAQRSQRLKVRERSEAFSPELHPGTEFHSTFLHMLRDGASPAGLRRARESHHLFTDTVNQLLCSTRPLTYS